jgi:hypothetical protein
MKCNKFRMIIPIFGILTICLFITGGCSAKNIGRLSSLENQSQVSSTTPNNTMSNISSKNQNASSSFSTNSIAVESNIGSNLSTSNDLPNIMMETAKITSSQVKSINAGSTYQQIIDKLGETANFGFLGLRQYLVDNEKLLILRFNSLKDICNLSGGDLLNTTISIKYPDGTLPKPANQNEFIAYGIMIDNGLFSCYGQYYGCYSISDKNSEIFYKNGNKATSQDIKIMSCLLITFDSTVLDTTLPQASCKKIVIYN